MDGTLLIASRSARQLWLLDLESDSIRARVPTGPGSREIALSPDGARAVVSNFGERTPATSLTVLDVAAGAAIKTIELGAGHRPHGVAWPSEDRVLVTSEMAKLVLEVSPEQGSIVREFATEQAGSHMLCVRGDGQRGFVTSLGGMVTVLDLAAGEVVENVPTQPGAEGTQVSASGDLWVAHRIVDRVSVLDSQSMQVKADLPCPGYPLRMSAQAAGPRVMVACPKRAEVAIYDTQTLSPVSRVSFNRLAGAPGVLGRIAMRLTRSTPFGLCAHPTRPRGFVSHPKSGRLSVLDLNTGAVVSHRQVCPSPDGLAWSPVTARGRS